MIRRSLRLLAGIAVFGIVAVGVAELGLQVAALFARGRGSGWRPEAAHRILCVGDSHTYGALVPVEASYPGHLQRFLDEREPGAYSVMNLGIPGMSTSQVRAELPGWLQQYRPELLIVWCGVNNAWNRTQATRTEVGRWPRFMMRSRLYRLFRVWRHDRQLNVLGAQLQAEQQRYDIVDHTDPEGPQRKITIVMDGRTEQIAFADSGFHEDAEMEERAANDYEAMLEEATRAGVSVVFVTYPIERGAFSRANGAIRRVAARHGTPVVESWKATRRVPAEQRKLLWAAHPNGPMYEEIARDILPVVLGEKPAPMAPPAPASEAARPGAELARLTFEPPGVPPDGALVNGSCTTVSADCAEGTGCYAWNPRGGVCNVQKRVPPSGRARAALKLRVAAFPTGIGGHDVFGLSESTYGTGVYVQFTATDRLRLLSTGSEAKEGHCGPLATPLALKTWYGVRVQAAKSNRAVVRLELLDNQGKVLDSVSCENQPTGGGAFTHVQVGSGNGLGATADVTLDDVSVHDDTR
jgi:lysophospholipase L1-like esterase